MARSFVKTNRRQLNIFLDKGGKLKDLGMVVGQTSGKPKYPKGHTGSKSRKKGRTPGTKIHKRELERRASIRAASKQLAGLDKETRKESRKRLVAMFKREKVRFKGLGRRGRAPAVAVAKVAGIIAADKTTGQYHRRVLGDKRKINIPEAQLRGAMILENKSMGRVLTEFGRKKKAEVRQSFASTGHTDTGRLFRNIQFIVWTVSGKKRVLDLERAQRAVARAQRRLRKARGKRG